MKISVVPFPKLTSSTVKTVLFLLLLTVSLVATAQPSHWRYALSVGRTKPFTHLTTAQPIADDRLTVNSRTVGSVRAALERSLSTHLSLRASVGHTTAGYGFRSANRFRDTTGRIFSQSVTSSRSTGTNLTVGTLGFTFNSNAYGRAILTAGFDGVVRINSGAGATRRLSGGTSTGSTTFQGVTQVYETVYLFETQPLSPVTWGMAARLGLDYRLSKRSFITTEISYTKGFGYVLRAASTDLRIDGVVNQGRYESRGSNVTVQIGYKRSLFRVNPLDPLSFTPYNRPEFAPQRTLSAEQRHATFRRRAWQYELRGSYRFLTALNTRGRLVGTGSSILGTGGTVGYFVAQRQLVGLAVDYQRYGDGSAPGRIGDFVQMGPLFRTYAGRGRVAPYLEGGYQAGWFAGPSAPKRFVESLPLTLGFSIRAGESVRLNASYGVRCFWQDHQGVSTLTLPQLGLTFSPKPLVKQS